MSAVTILYGSQTGTAKYEAELFCIELSKTGIAVEVKPCNDCSLKDLAIAELVFFMVATTGQGDPPFNMRRFWDSIFIGQPLNLLSKIQFSVFGFGDSSYAKYNFVSRVLSKRLSQLGGNEFVPTQLGNENTSNGYMDTLLKWKTAVINKLVEKEIVSDFDEKAIENLFLQTKDIFDIQIVGNDSQSISSSKEATFKKGDLKSGKVIEQIRLTEDNHFQRVYDLYIQPTEPTMYTPGDLICLHYQNVDDHINLLSNHLDMDISETIVITRKLKGLKMEPYSFEGKPITVKELLKNHLDFVKPPSLYLIRQLANLTTDELYQEKLSQMPFDDYYDYVVKERRSIWEILFDFRISKIPLSILINYCPLIRPREFSIASSFKADPKTIRIVYGVVEFHTPFKRKFIRQN